MSEGVEVPTHWQPGSVIAGRFRVVRVLGVGGMGAVLEAENVTLGQRVALKVLRRELVHDREAHARLDQEARVVSQLVTDHVARVHDLGKTEHGEPFIVMELLAGRTLDDIIEAPASLTVAAAVDLVCEACVGVAVAHRAGMVHRDIKPGNLFVAERSDGSNVVKVLDFGLTKVTRSDTLRLTTSASVFGTPLYMSPEQIMSSKRVDARTDQHAMAMVLFELLTKRPPYYDDSPTAVTVMIATHPVPSLAAYRPEVPPLLDAIVGKALSKAPDERFQDIALFALALAQFGTARADAAAKRAAAALDRSAVAPQVPLASTRTPETVAGLSTRSAETRRRSATPIALVVAGAVVIVALGTVITYRLTGASPGPDPASAARSSPEAAAPAPSPGAPALDPDAISPASAEPAPPPSSASSSGVASAAPSASVSSPSPPAKPRPASPPRPTAQPTAQPGEYIPKYTPKK